MRYEAVGNNLHGALAGEDHREDDFNFFLKRNRVNNLPWSVDGSWWWCWECCWLTKNSLTAVVSLLGVGWKTARQRQVPQIAAKMNACEHRGWGRLRLYWVGRYKDRRQDERLREDQCEHNDGNCYISGWYRLSGWVFDMVDIKIRWALFLCHTSKNLFSTISISLFLTGFLRPQTHSEYGSLSTGGLAPTLRACGGTFHPHHSSILILIIILIIIIIKPTTSPLTVFLTGSNHHHHN